MRARTFAGRTAAALVVTTVLIAAVATAQAGPSTKTYSVALAPGIAAAGSTATYTVTLSNGAGSTQTLGSANVVVPSGFEVTSIGSPSASGNKAWSATLVAGVVELRASDQKHALSPGESVSAALTVQTACEATTATWSSRAKQSNNFNGPPGNDFANSAADPVLTVTGGGAAVSLAFVAQPSTSKAGSSVSPAVTVRALDACGNAASGSVAIAVANNPSGGTLGGTASRPLIGGLASFDDLRIDRTGRGYTLAASLESASATSASFDVVDELCTSTSALCTASDGARTTTVSTDVPPAGGTMALAFTSASSFTCGQSSFATRGALAIIDPVGYSAPIRTTARWSKSVAPGTGVANFVFCWSKDGVGYEVAQPCTKSGALPANVGLCELKRNRDGVGELVIQFLIHPVDPWAGLG